jgi:group II intron reverse transcriptase/maturase
MALYNIQLIEDEIMDKAKQFNIPKEIVWKAWKRVKTNQGASGVDQESIEEFETKLGKNLYKIWNRMSSGTYFPPSVKGVEIPKKQGGKRLLGIPTISDRIAQMVVKIAFEPCVEPYFLADSYGYRPNKSAIDAIAVTRQRCWKHDYVLEFDIKGLFDNIDHELMIRAVRKHTKTKWVILYIERWLEASMKMPNGTIVKRTCGTPQGGVISPVLSNLFLHYVFDMWMKRNHESKLWCRYADDGLVHCKTLQEAEELLKVLKQRFSRCKLELHPIKTKIVYCKDGTRKGKHENTKFKFLGYEFRRRITCNRYTKSMRLNFTPAICPEAKKAITAKLRELNSRRRTDLEIEQIAAYLNPKLIGWLNYYGKFTKSAMYVIWMRVNSMLVSWARRKYKHLRGHKTNASMFIERIAKTRSNLFIHWKLGVTGSFV